jgi:hypothetical protein
MSEIFSAHERNGLWAAPNALPFSALGSAISGIGDCHLIGRADVGNKIGGRKAVDIVAADHRFTDMPTTGTANENEIIRGMEEDTISVVSQQGDIRIGPESQDGPDVALAEIHLSPGLFRRGAFRGFKTSEGCGATGRLLCLSFHQCSCL